jgi:uncharacterized protein YjbI with pentapeptide repeats
MSQDSQHFQPTKRSPFSEEEATENNGATDNSPDFTAATNHQSGNGSKNRSFFRGGDSLSWQQFWQSSQLTAIAVSLVLMLVGFATASQFGIGLALLGSVATLLLSLTVVAPNIYQLWRNVIPPKLRSLLVASTGLLAAILGLLELSSAGQTITFWLRRIDWEIAGALGEILGALGQVFIAVLAVYVAWRQYVISKDLTIQQNRITQQQTIDTYFQGVSDLALDEQGFLEDWPQERAIAEGRTAAILSSVDAEGKAKIIRFLSQSRLLTPLQRDRVLGRAILDGAGGYAEDRAQGLRVINLGVMLAGADLQKTDLRWTDLSDANLVRANLSGCDLVKANFSRTILYEANLSGADLKGTRLFYGSPENASPRSRTEFPNYQSGDRTGAVVENVILTEVQNLSVAQRYYCCAWGGEKTRQTIPGGCEGIPNLLGR